MFFLFMFFYNHVSQRSLILHSLSDKGIAIKVRYLSTPGARELGPSIDVIEIQDDIVYMHCNLY
jgi:hypothetical protein